MPSPRLARAAAVCVAFVLGCLLGVELRHVQLRRAATMTPTPRATARIARRPHVSPHPARSPQPEPTQTFSQSSPELSRLSKRLDRLDLDLCFAAGSAELDTGALVNIGKIVAIVQNDPKPNRRVVLAAFSNGTHDRARAAALSKKRAGAAAREFTAQGVHLERTFGFTGSRDCTVVFLTR